MEAERLLQLAGAINAYCALLAERAGFRALYLSGAGVANASFGLPDLGLTTLTNVCEDLRRITGATHLPVLVDADTGWGPAAPAIERAIRELERAGAAGCHIEDQASAKRCGHRPGKQLVSVEEMSDRLTAAVAGRRDPAFLIVARTDALAAEGVAATLQRARRYVDAGADAIFLEAAATLDDYRKFAAELPVPILANITEFGVTPLFTVEELRDAGVRMALYPLTAFRAMQTRAELYEVLRYLDYERQFDEPSAGKEGS